MSEQDAEPSPVVRCESCRAAVDASLTDRCPFCGTALERTAAPQPNAAVPEPPAAAPVEPQSVPPPEPIPPPQPVPPPTSDHAREGEPEPDVVDRRSGGARGPALATRIVVLALGLGALATTLALIQRSPDPDRGVQTTRRELPAAVQPSAQPSDDGEAMAPAPAPAPAPDPDITPARCPDRIEGDIDRHYSFERSRLGLWFDRLERYNDHGLRIDGDRSAHARRDAQIDRARASRLDALDHKRADAANGCDPRLLA